MAIQGKETLDPYISRPFSREVTKKKSLDVRSEFLRKRKVLSLGFLEDLFSHFFLGFRFFVSSFVRWLLEIHLLLVSLETLFLLLLLILPLFLVLSILVYRWKLLHLILSPLSFFITFLF